MPEYLKYHDCGYMYTPNSTFIPFLHEVDDYDKEVVNQKGFQEYNDDLIKVCNLYLNFHTIINSLTTINFIVKSTW